MTNIYDDSTFFHQYSKMKRSTEGLTGAGEWHAVESLLPDLNGTDFLDLGCGYGWHAVYASEHNAAHIITVDQSQKMIETAKEKNKRDNIEYHISDVSSFVKQLESQGKTFDVVLSSLVLHYIENIETLFTSIHSIMKKGATFIFTVEHPVFTAEGSQNWVYNDDGTIAHFPVDHYFHESNRTTEFLGVNVTKYHRKIETYVKTLLNNGFHIKNIIEPKPAEYLMHTDGMKDELRRPMMLIIKVEK